MNKLKMCGKCQALISKGRYCEECEMEKKPKCDLCGKSFEYTQNSVFCKECKEKVIEMNKKILNSRGIKVKKNMKING